MPVEPVVVITGAGSGLGRSLAISLASKGHGLALVGRSKERLLQTQADIANADCLILPVDVTEEGASEYIVNETLDAFHRIDAVVNNAGMARMATIEQLELAEAEAMERAQDSFLESFSTTPAALPASSMPEPAVIAAFTDRPQKMVFRADGAVCDFCIHCCVSCPQGKHFCGHEDRSGIHPMSPRVE